MRFVPGQLMLVAEVGETGRVFRLDDDTVFTVKPKTGTRVRVLYVETPEGPLAKKVMPGPEEAGK